MIKKIVWTVVFGMVAAILQSTLLPRITLYRAVPDLALGILVYSAYINGVMAGQLSGFCYGILLDCISFAPLGLNALVRTLIGALAGIMKGTFFLDVFFLPMVLCAAATCIKAGSFFLLHLLLAGAVPAYSPGSPVFWIELILNTVSAPFLFALLKRFPSLFVGRNR